MRFLLFFTFLFLNMSGKLYAQSYSGKIDYGQSSINYQVRLKEMADQTKVLFSSVDMNAYEIPCQNATYKNDSLNFYVVSDYYTYEYLFIRHNDGFRGKLNLYSNESDQQLNSFETNLLRVNTMEEEIIEKKEFSFTSNGLTLYGTMWKPKKSTQKGLLFVSSSQGNDRNGTNAEAYYFSNLGYTVFNYDKRGTGKSEGEWQSATIEDLCSDDMNAAIFFSGISTLSLSEIGIKGSSQGGIKIPYILTELPQLGFGISISCPGGTLLESDLNYWKNSNIAQIGEEKMETALKVQKAGFDYLAGNISFETLEHIKDKYKNQEWMTYVWLPDSDVKKDYKLNFSGLPYFRKITQPILVIQGLSDMVIPDTSYKMIRKAIGKSKSADYEVLILENTTHSMTYLSNEYPYFQVLSPNYLVSVSEWLNKIEKK